MASSFVIVDNFYVQSVASAELEADTPSSIDGNGPLAPTITLQSMKANTAERA
jgi:hypothetical protein